MWYRFSCQHGIQGIPQIGNRRRLPLFAEIDHAVIYAAKVEQFSIGCQDGNLRRDGGAGESHQLLIRIEQQRVSVAKVSGIFGDIGHGDCQIGLDRKERHTPRAISVLDAVQLGYVAVGDGTIGGSEEQHQRLAASKFRLGMHYALRIAKLEVQWRGECRGGEEAQNRNKSHLSLQNNALPYKNSLDSNVTSHPTMKDEDADVSRKAVCQPGRSNC